MPRSNISISLLLSQLYASGLGVKVYGGVCLYNLFYPVPTASIPSDERGLLFCSASDEALYMQICSCSIQSNLSHYSYVSPILSAI